MLSSLPHFLRWPLVSAVATAGHYDLISGQRIRRDLPCVKLGSDYGGWTVPTGWLTRDDICYCAGVGEDITFDLGLIGAFGCHVYAIDPTPRAVEHVRKNAQDQPNFHFEQVGLWNEDTTQRFYAPANPKHVSHSVMNLQKTGTYFEAECVRVSTLLARNGHENISLLKLDIEGAEYKVLDSLLEDGIRPKILCIEFDEAYHPLDAHFIKRIRSQVARLVSAGYSAAALESRCNYTFVLER